MDQEIKKSPLRPGVVRVLENIITSGKSSENNETGLSDYLIRYVLMNITLIFGFFILCCFIVESLLKGSYTDALINSGMLFMCPVAFILGRTRVPQVVPILISLISYMLLCVLLVWNGDAGGFGFVWIYTYPLLAIMLMNMKNGIVLSGTLFVLISLEIFIPGLSKYPYTADMASRLIMGYVMVMVCTVIFEMTRITKDRISAKLNADVEQERQKAEAATVAKSNFLATMSHEIRTPMNAIIGMSDLALREDMSPRLTEYINEVKQAGSNLLAIINDILDFSKIESGKLDVIAEDYSFASFINDIISIIKIRINEKPIQFATKIDGSLPDMFCGDVIRLRQILLNLLTNAVKYTNEGHIILSIHGEDMPHQMEHHQEMLLYFEVADTGIGIKDEDIVKLFGNFVQVDTKHNQGVEGTGLGLAISRNLCQLMGGNITVKSEYGKGSVFTARIPQMIRNPKPFALVEQAETKKALVYEDRPVYAESMTYTINNLGLGCSLVQKREDFIKALPDYSGQLVFSSPALFEGVREYIQDRVRSNPLNAFSLALVSEYGQETLPGITTIFMPIQPLVVANVFNGKEALAGLEYQENKKSSIRFSAPDARILIVDDLPTNLNVASGLLAPYGMKIDCATGGLEALCMIGEKPYDLVLMDHMMPGMDGVEAAAAIRIRGEEYYQKLPIIALTANAVSGMKEMFLANGFNDFISKPIDIAKLDECMFRWIPKNKQKKPLPSRKRPKAAAEGLSDEAVPALQIEGVDVPQGIAMTGDNEEEYRKILQSFYRDAEERLPYFDKLGGDLPVFTSQVHAIKGAAATIGALTVSKEAAALEAAGKAGDWEAIGVGLPTFYGHLEALTGNIKNALAKEDKGGEKPKDAPAEPAKKEAANPAAEGRKPEKIIMVDDNATILMTGKGVLSSKYEVHTAPSAEQMFLLLEEIKPALILLDVDMPVMNGFEAIRILKSKPETAGFPVIFLTGNDDTGAEQEGLDLGAVDYIIKPFKPAQLLKSIETHIKGIKEGAL
ncbi:hypothetical protein AGMMS49546_16270 [Spirochaetia bacterium]|nr:hypothetical protein AGMMS49546_16270 [Spirochaetia bacterium]